MHQTRSTLLALLFFFGCGTANAQLLEQSLLAEPPAKLADDVVKLGDAARGAIVFHQPHFACGKCHSTDRDAAMLGPNLANPILANIDEPLSNADLVDAVLRPSKQVREKYQSVNVLTDSGTVHTGTIQSQSSDQIVLNDVSNIGKTITIDRDEIESIKKIDVSIMPAGQVNQLAGRQQFLDLIKYLVEIRDGGRKRALELQPPPHLLVAPPVPEYEKTIDHAGLIADLDDDAFERGQAIYNRLCINCHGTKDQPGSLPTSLRFASGKFKNGSDPFAMYQTLTRGFGMMLPQTWMVPQQKYDVIHYIRRQYLRPHNPSQLFKIDDEYLASLPKGDSRGPMPSNVEAWVNMDYGPSMINTFETGKDAKNFAYKGIAVRLDQGPGGVSRGNSWTIFDHDTMRLSTAWTQTSQRSGSPFIDWQGIHFNGRHNIHPRVSGDVHLENHTGPGWANPKTGSFDDPRLVGRDGRKYGPLPNEWARLHGVYSYGPKTVVDYQIGQTRIQESHAMLGTDDATIEGNAPTFARLFNIAPRQSEMTLQVATVDQDMRLQRVGQSVVLESSATVSENQEPWAFNGGSYGETQQTGSINMHDRDFSISARIRTKSDGTIFAKTTNAPKWVPNGKSFFIRGGRLTFDIGWVGAAQSRRKVADGKWHDVAMTWKPSGECKFYVDGKNAGGGRLKPKAKLSSAIVRVGFTAKNFPAKPFFDGQLRDVRFVQRCLSQDEITSLAENDAENPTGAVAHWPLDGDPSEPLSGLNLTTHQGESKSAARANAIAAGLSVPIPGSEWTLRDDHRLCLTIPPGDAPLKFILWSRSSGFDGQVESADTLVAVECHDASPDLGQWMNGGPARWPEILTTTVQRGSEDGPFAVDVLQAPAANPWSARVRLTGFDFFDDADRMAVCAWDGDVWLVSGLSKIDSETDEPVQLTWQRIASGLFQPLGLRIVDGQIYVSCRDQICILHDLNGDRETDFYECFNRDHQVTDHFHEFAMGLQTDDEGNFYYAKSARHALKALVPHHGTLLRVSKDGSKTDILANGFRAANGVCLNPDGSFIVTDQEGHWNPKNRINWVEPGGFYGNMFGYHDVSDSSDSAMSQPLCWITNSFDRSPAELLWVDSDAWGPLNKQLLNLSYGYGKVYVVPHEDIGGQKQGGMCAFPIPQFPTGTMRGRFRRADGQLYVCGMFAWAGSQKQDGGLYRLRYTGKPAHLPVGLSAKESGMQIEFSDELNRASAEDPENYSVKVWSLKRTANYGSKHYDERFLTVASAKLAADGKTVRLVLPEIAPTWCMEIRAKLNSKDGRPVDVTIHNTIHQLGVNQ